jgi:hypothetical protein
MIGYYSKKAVAKIFSKALSARYGLARERAVYAGSFGKCFLSKTVVLAFWDRALVHLGDQLFHQPLVEHLLARGYTVVVDDKTPLAPYFEALGARVMSVEDMQQKLSGALFVSKDDMVFDIWRRFGEGNAVAGINYGGLESDDRVAVSIARIVLRTLRELGDADVGDERDAIVWKPRVPQAIVDRYATAPWKEKLSAAGDKKILAFSNYVASDIVQARGREAVLEQMARDKKKEGFCLVHLGSAQEKRGDARVYDFIDIDLRGDVDVIGLFAFFADARVAGIVGFDAYNLHVAVLCGKGAWVVMKDENKKDRYAKKFVPMHQALEPFVKKIV